MEDYIRVALVSDGDGHNFVIPYTKRKRFYQVLEKSEIEDDYDDFNDEFEMYRCNQPDYDYELLVKKSEFPKF